MGRKKQTCPFPDCFSCWYPDCVQDVMHEPGRKRGAVACRTPEERREIARQKKKEWRARNREKKQQGVGNSHEQQKHLSDSQTGQRSDAGTGG